MTRIERSIEVNVSVHTAYEQLTRFEQYPHFVEGVDEVRQLDDTHLHLHTKAGNLDMKWDTEITQQVPDRSIAWRNTSGPQYEGKIELQPLEGDRTRVTLTMEYDPKQQLLAQHGNAETAIAQRVEHDLAQFKRFIEKDARKPQEALGKEIAKTITEMTEAARAATRDAEPAPQAPQAPQQEQRGGMDMMSLQPSWLPGLLQAWDGPFSLMRRITEDMDQMFERFIGRPLYGSRMQATVQADGQSTAWTPPVEVVHREDRFTVCAELAGVKREDVRVEIEGDRLTIEGDRRQEPPQAPQELRQSERTYGHFYRVIALPPGANTDAVSASLHDGMLEIMIPVVQRGAREGRQVEIKTQE